MTDFLFWMYKRSETGRLRTEVFRKPTHTDRYLHYRSYHHHSTKQGIIKTLTHRCQTIYRDDEARRAEQLHLNKVFKSNGYPTGFIHRATNKKIPEPRGQQPSTRICITYIKGIGEQIRKICNREGIQVTFRSRRTLRTILTKVKPSQPDTDIKGVVYRIPCKDCDETYIGETGRTLKTRLQEHKRDVRLGHTTTNAVAYHAHSQLHQIDWDNAEVVDREQQFYMYYMYGVWSAYITIIVDLLSHVHKLIPRRPAAQVSRPPALAAGSLAQPVRESGYARLGSGHAVRVRKCAVSVAVILH